MSKTSPHFYFKFIHISPLTVIAVIEKKLDVLHMRLGG
jgi:hypothetical protein